jgi:murein DD-endopeptidase MepM/ murein hydrolase activator NlpD
MFASAFVKAGYCAAFMLFLLSLISCGGSSDTEAPDLSANPPEAESSIGRNGGSLELAGIAKVDFPAGAFLEQVKLTIKETEIDAGNMDDYKRSISAAGVSSGKMLIVMSPVQPKADAVVEYTVPDEFLASLELSSEPRLFAKFDQSGADDEKHDDFESLSAQLSADVLTATLPNTAFTDERPESNGLYEAIVVIGSYADGDNFKNTSPSFFLSSGMTLSDSCTGGNYIGSPLEGNLEITSGFGRRIHPITKKESDHYGMDLRADTGDDVLAVADGVVEAIGFNYNPQTGRGWGRYVAILHPDGSRTRYAHLKEGSTDDLHVGDHVAKGEVIGKADTTGGATGPHLHFEYERRANSGKDIARIDPFPCIKLPVQITAIDTGGALFSPVYGIPFEVHVNIPEGNSIYSKRCEISGNPADLGYYCWASSPCSLSDYSPEEIQGCISFFKPRGSASAEYHIRDKFGNEHSMNISAAWDCCDDPNDANYLGIKLSCYTLGDKEDRCGQ